MSVRGSGIGRGRKREEVREEKEGGHAFRYLLLYRSFHSWLYFIYARN